MQQYARIKSEHRDAILFFRLGDFYEMFRQDAEDASRILGLTLTSRQGVPMCGVPHHSSRGYIGRLLKEGRKVAICEQITLPQDGKGLAEREVVEVITPGTVTEEDYLEARTNNYLVSFAGSEDAVYLAYADLSTGELVLGSDDRAPAVFVRSTVARLRPREILVPQSLLEDPQLGLVLKDQGDALLNPFPDWQYDLQLSHRRLRTLFGVLNLKAFEIPDESDLPLAAGTLIEYMEESIRTGLPHFTSLRVESEDGFLGLDENTVRNLELVANMRDGSRRYSLLEIIDQTRTSMGARTVRRWVLSPLKDIEAIAGRQKQVGILYHDQRVLTILRDHLGHILDIERLAARIALKKAHAKDLVAVRNSIDGMLAMLTLLSEKQPELDFCLEIDSDMRARLSDTAELIRRSILDEPSTSLTEGRLIRSGYDDTLDELHRIRDDSHSILDEYLEEERARTGIPSLKVKNNRVIGHFLEVTANQADRVPADFVRRQSLANAERFSTARLGEIESRINDAAERIITLEQEIFLNVREDVAGRLGALKEAARLVAELDVYQGLAYTATTRGYVSPHLVPESVLSISGGRHPVVEAFLKPGEFVPNATQLDPDGVRLALITGPNMAGKSTYLRQVALIVLLAHIGSFVPADDATIGLTDRIFCRVGASDNLARGESTFLVEMNEAAHILRNASSRSLVIMDEIGRGTSTNDGLAIAQAVIEDLLDRVGCRALFATHFHELTSIVHHALRNWSLRVVEDSGGIVFLKSLEEGPSSNSYGIHVARVAGVPEAVVRRSEDILAVLVEREKPGGPPHEVPATQQRESRAALPGPGLFSSEELIAQEIRSVSLAEMRPIDALNMIDRWKRELGEP